jgi:hypothetical protein
MTPPAARAALLALAVVVAAAGCGATEAEPDPIGEAEAGIAAVLAERLDVAEDEILVACPADLEVEVGTAFACAVTIGAADPVDVDLAVEADGTVELQRAVIPTDAVETYLAAELAGPAEGPVEPDCGEPPLLVADVGDELRCEVVRTADGAVRPVVVTVLALDGTVRYRVEAPAAPTTTTATTAPPP